MMTHERYESVREHYWVLSFANEKAAPFDWVFSVHEPQPVPNPTMSWRRPTYEETLDRQHTYEADTQHFDKCAGNRDLRKYDRGI